MADSKRGSGDDARLSRAAAARFSLYLRSLEDLLRHGETKVSSSQLGSLLGVSDAQVRKDLTWLGKLGHPGIGYNIEELTKALRHALGIDRPWRACLVGVGNLARALLRYTGFREHGFEVSALFDAAPDKIGQEIDGLIIQPMESIQAVISELKIELGLITVPSSHAQAVADRLTEAGIRGILNFAPTLIRLPTGVHLVSVDLTVQFEQLAFMIQMNSD